MKTYDRNYTDETYGNITKDWIRMPFIDRFEWKLGLIQLVIHRTTQLYKPAFCHAFIKRILID